MSALFVHAIFSTKCHCKCPYNLVCALTLLLVPPPCPKRRCMPVVSSHVCARTFAALASYRAMSINARAHTLVIERQDGSDVQTSEGQR
eukprot:1038799-Pelagomonas_calceolata.AAC.1